MFYFEKLFLKLLATNSTRIRSLRSVFYFIRWRNSCEILNSPLEARTPWMTFQSANMLGKELNANSSVFEYGGGGSTLFCLDKGAKVITIEHDKQWFDRLKQNVFQSGIEAKWEGKFTPPNLFLATSQPRDPADPDSYVSSDQAFTGFSFENYATSIDVYEDASFDVIIIDGRSRPSCLKHASTKLKCGGLLFLDNTERDYYLTDRSMDYLQGFRLVLDEYGPTYGLQWFTKTSVWRRIN
jgi:hypothetical protein